MPDGDQAGDLVVQRLPINRDVFIHDHQFDGQSFHPPVGVRLDQLADELDVLACR